MLFRSNVNAVNQSSRQRVKRRVLSFLQKVKENQLSFALMLRNRHRFLRLKVRLKLSSRFSRLLLRVSDFSMKPAQAKRLSSFALLKHSRLQQTARQPRLLSPQRFRVLQA